MGRKWGSNEDIHIGDIFECTSVLGGWCREEYYQVVALRGRTQVVLHAIRSETYIGEDIVGDSSLRKQKCPLPGQFIRVDEMPEIREYWKQGKLIRSGGERVTAWVSPERAGDGSLLLREVGELEIYYLPVQPENWEP